MQAAYACNLASIISSHHRELSGFGTPTATTTLSQRLCWHLHKPKNLAFRRSSHTRGCRAGVEGVGSVQLSRLLLRPCAEAQLGFRRAQRGPTPGVSAGRAATAIAEIRGSCFIRVCCTGGIRMGAHRPQLRAELSTVPYSPAIKAGVIPKKSKLLESCAESIET